MCKGLKKLSTLFFMALFIGGCATKEESTSFQAYRPGPGYSVEERAAGEGGKAVVANARKVIGTPYVRGGSRPGGFDCSGLVMWAYQKVGVQLPRTAREQSSVGVKIQNKNDMKPGDIVAFHHPKRGYHTGIYIGDGKFIHSPRKRSSVKISSLDSDYFKSTLLGARRVAIECDDTVLLAAAQPLGREAGIGYQEISDTPTPILKKFKKSSRSSKKVQRTRKSVKRDSGTLVASKKAAKKAAGLKTVAAAKKTKNNVSAKKASKNVREAKKNAKTVAVNASKAKASHSRQKKSGHQTVSMLHKKSR